MLVSPNPQTCVFLMESRSDTACILLTVFWAEWVFYAPNIAVKSPQNEQTYQFWKFHNQNNSVSSPVDDESFLRERGEKIWEMKYIWKQEKAHKGAKQILHNNPLGLSASYRSGCRYIIGVTIRRSWVRNRDKKKSSPHTRSLRFSSRRVRTQDLQLVRMTLWEIRVFHQTFKLGKVW